MDELMIAVGVLLVLLSIIIWWLIKNVPIKEKNKMEKLWEKERVVEDVEDVGEEEAHHEVENVYGLNWEMVKARFKFPNEIGLILQEVDAFMADQRDRFQLCSPLVNPYAFALAVRHQESGRPGLEFGVMNNEARLNIHTQLNWFLWTFLKDTERWYRDELINVGGRTRKDFGAHTAGWIHYFGSKYCPVGASNDPSGLNQHWIPNVKRFYSAYNLEVNCDGICGSPQKEN